MADVEARLAEVPSSSDQRPALVRLRDDPRLAAWHLAQVAAVPSQARPGDQTLAALAKAQREPDPKALGDWLTAGQAMALLSRTELADWLRHAPAPSGRQTSNPGTDGD
jgi:hypothetical protein